MVHILCIHCRSATIKKSQVTNSTQFISGRTPRAHSARIRLRTLVLMRWIAIGGQTATILFVNFVLHYPFPFVLTLVTVAVSVLLNIFLTLHYPVSKQLSDTEAGFYLFYDALQLSVLLFFTGGLHNPFSFLVIAAAIISAAVLSVRMTIKLIAFLLLCVSVLVFFHLPLPGPAGQHSIMQVFPSFLPGQEGQQLASNIFHPPLPGPDGQHPISHIYVFGIWCSLVVGMIFFSANVMRVAEEGRRMSNALMETQMALAREQLLSAVGGLAAAAAHELGTPLGTIALVAKELSREFPADSPTAEDLRLLLSQSERCRDILTRLTLESADGSSPSPHPLPFMTMVEMAARSPPRENIEVTVEHDPSLTEKSDWRRERTEDQASVQPVAPHSLEITHGLKNIIENAVDFARSRVSVKVGWSEQQVVVEITDDGPGFSRDILGALGEPYVSTRRDAGGMGLGVFIAKTLLERTGAEIGFGNRKGGGAKIVIAWPRGLFAEFPAATDDVLPLDDNEAGLR